MSDFISLTYFKCVMNQSAAFPYLIQCRIVLQICSLSLFLHSICNQLARHSLVFFLFRFIVSFPRLTVEEDPFLSFTNVLHNLTAYIIWCDPYKTLKAFFHHYNSFKTQIIASHSSSITVIFVSANLSTSP